MTQTLTSPAPAALSPDAAQPQSNLRRMLVPLALDIAAPLACYYVLHGAFGLSEVAALAVSGVIPAVRVVAGIVRERTLNGMAALTLVVNVAGIALSFLTGDARMMIAKDSGLSGVLSLAILLSAFTRRPVMTAGMRPFVTRGNAAKEAAWERLAEGSARFRRAERRFSAIWGGVLLAECVVRLAGAFTLPVATMIWLSNVLLIAAIALGLVLAGAFGSGPIMGMVGIEAGSGR
ncbi:VC0807 family protein [Microbispora sp. H10670]|uniref:VC0807 family protein n=1 Tax=Microbispora sp. H10670 TaxID=2729108 RepID=UPI001C7282C8|nr:VC0807 family protein [Microbispora sp. H10670]